ncbi:MAG: restriction endonuclease subunit S [Prevotella sp.]|nr:restriction endonuclease subunit S [Prevotella sp.]
MVERKQLREVCFIHVGEQLNRDTLTVDGMYPVINGGKTPSGYTGKYNEKGETITIAQGGAAGFVNWIDRDFWAGAHCYVIEPTECVNKRYLFHLLKENERQIQKKAQGAGIPGLRKTDLLSYNLVITSKSEQDRIASTLDTFSYSIENLKEQIKQRRVQSEYYRNELLSFKGSENVTMRSMGELFDFKNGLNKGKEFFGKGKLIIMFSDVFNSNSLDSIKVSSRVDISDDELKRIDARVGDVFFTRTSETKEDVGYASVLLEDLGECTFAGFLIRARPRTNLLIPAFCKYCFSTKKMRNSIVEKSSFTTRASLTGPGLSKITMPIPSIEEQSHIVSILDTFEASIQNLEAQLKLREKQYEYYRNKLLTFE